MPVPQTWKFWMIVFLLLFLSYLTWISAPESTVFKENSLVQLFRQRLIHEVQVNKQPLSKVVILTFNESLPVRNDPFVYKRFIDIEETFYRYFLWYTDAFCPHMLRVGKLPDGGWDVCVSSPYYPTPGECTVLSFGINNDFSFDDDINSMFNCNVHSFDPSMETKSYKRRDRMWFHQIGLAAANGTTSKGWKMMSFKDTLEYLHLTKTVIDILKFDIEGSEWEVLESMYKDGSFAKVKQMMFEIHISNRDATEVSLKAVVNTLNYLHTIGFRRYYVHHNAQCIQKGNLGLKFTRVKCMEVYYINTNYFAAD